MTFLDIFGYAASVVVLISLTMSSLLKLRWINLAGATLFSTYGFIIGAIPVGVLNGAIALIDVYYLYKMYSKVEYFKIIEVRPNSLYLQEFFRYYKSDIQKYFPGFIYKPELNTMTFTVVRDMNVAAIFLAHPYDNQTLLISLDYAIPMYRDFKLGNFIYLKNNNYFIDKGFKRLCAKSSNSEHEKYLQKMGFIAETINNEKIWFKLLN